MAKRVRNSRKGAADVVRLFNAPMAMTYDVGAGLGMTTKKLLGRKGRR